MTHYDEFGVAPTATAEEIQRAHRNLARLLHPDRIQDEDLRQAAEGQLKRFNAIYSVLMDPARRRGYDLQLLAPPRRPPRPPRSTSKTWVAAAVALVAGFEISTRWHGAPSSERVVYVDRPVAATVAPAKPAEEWRPPLSEETRELRRALNQVALERDHALARLAAVQPVAPAAPVVAAAVSPATAAAAPADAPPPAAEALPKALPPRLTGTWIYSNPGGRQTPGDQYPAEYIELVLIERDEALWGRYRARYKVPDRALSPEVEFFFEGPGTGGRRYAWRGNGGARGEVSLQTIAGGALSLNWFTSHLGSPPMLGSGTAVLVRRQD